MNVIGTFFKSVFGGLADSLVWVVAATCLAAGGLLGWHEGRAPLLLQIAQTAEAQAKANFTASERAVARLQAAATLGDQLTTVINAKQTEIDKLKQERRNAITKNTTGQPCFGGPALRLLNGAPGLRVSNLPTATGSALAASGIPAADTFYASDTDVATWAIDAGAAYETCRARLGALIDWHGANP